MFPGQGTQRTGMGQALFHGFDEAAATLAGAAAITGRDLGALMRRGPSSVLTRTGSAQVAVTTVSLAALAVLRARAVAYDAVAGHSVGMLAALAAADVLDPADAIALAARRGTIMDALPLGGSMVSVAGLASPIAVDVVRMVRRRTGSAVVVGLVNGPQNVVVSGEEAGVAEAVRALHEAGSSSAVPLTVSHAFHSPLMSGARPAWQDVVAAQPLRNARIPVLADSTGEPLISQRAIREFLVEQLTSPVRWDLVCRHLCASGEREAIEMGDSKALRSLGLPYEQLRVTTMAAPQFLASLRDPGRTPLRLAGRTI
nr:ACP S-malonyltransferase [Streptomyces sp. SID4948]